MTSLELIAAAEAAMGKGHRYVQITRSWQRSPKNWDRARVMPGVYGRIVGEVTPGRYLVDVPVGELLSALAVL